MRITSTPQSSHSQELSLLGLFETICAISGSIYIAIEFETTLHIVIGMLISPLLLLGSTRSSIISILIIEYIVEKFNIKSSVLPNFSIVLLFFIFIVAFFSIFISKIISVIYTLYLKPRRIFSTFKFNWFRMVFCIDVFHRPEPLYGLEHTRLGDVIMKKGKSNFSDILKFDFYRDFIFGKVDGLGEIYPRLLVLFFITPVYLISYFYRISLKSTALIWLPMLWVASQIKSQSDLQVRLAVIDKSATQRISRYWSLLVFLLFSAKIWLVVNWHQYTKWWNGNWGSDWLKFSATQIVWPDGLPLWQVSSALNAVLSWGLYVYASQILATSSVRGFVNKKQITNVINLINVTRTFLTVYIIFCTGYLAIKVAPEINLPDIDIILFPWSH